MCDLSSSHGVGNSAYVTYTYDKLDRIVGECYNGVQKATYTYDAWGNIESATAYNGSDIATLNPFRYRSYYYDAETNLYYLNTRYFDPQVGRFINADSIDIITASPEAFTDKNLYAYCDNNPVMRSDNGGEFWHIIAGGIIGGIVSAAVSIVTQALTNDKIDWVQVGIDAACGVVSGTLAAAGVPNMVTTVVDATLSAGQSVYSDIKKGDKSTGEIVSDALVSVGMSALFSSAGDNADGKNMNKLFKDSRSAKKALKNGVNPKNQKVLKATARAYNNKLGRSTWNTFCDTSVSNTFSSGLSELYKIIT